jgi:hypothetical protein
MPRFGRLSICGHVFLESLGLAIANSLMVKEIAAFRLAVHLQIRKLC